MLYQFGHIFLVSKRSYERSKVDSSESMPSIILSTIALECFVNETVERLSKENYREVEKCFSTASSWLDFVESKKGSTLEKIEALHLAFLGCKADRGVQPYQDLSLLYQLRNELVHRKVENFGDWPSEEMGKQYEPHRFVKALAKRGIIQLPDPTMPPLWGQFVLQEQTAKWAYNTALSGVHFIASMFPESTFSALTNILIQNVEPII